MTVTGAPSVVRADDEDVTSPRGRLAWSLPPLWPVVLGLWVVVCLHIILAALDRSPGPPAVWIIDSCVIAVAAAAGWFLRRVSRRTSRASFWQRTEDPLGTRPAAITLVLATAGVIGVTRSSSAWWAFDAGAVVASAIAVAVATSRSTDPPIDVIPHGEQPERVQDYLRITLPWDLAPALPDLSGEIGLWIRRKAVQEFRDKNPGTMWAPDGSTPLFEWYITEGQCQEVNDLADCIATIARDHGLTPYLEVALVLDLVQRLPYVADVDSAGRQDYWRFPLEMLADQKGDCEDSAILMTALLSAMGHKTCFFDITDHAAIGVTELPEESGVSFEATDGLRFYYVETTSDGWSIGQLPANVSESEVSVSSIVDPLRARRRDAVLRPAPPSQWRRDSILLMTLFPVVTTACAFVALAVSGHG